jgi:hypothetical protein
METTKATQHTAGKMEILYGGMAGDDYATIGVKSEKYPLFQMEPAGYNAANALELVRRWNRHEKLVEALEKISEGNAMKSVEIFGALDVVEAYQRIAREALALARGDK